MLTTTMTGIQLLGVLGIQLRAWSCICALCFITAASASASASAYASAQVFTASVLPWPTIPDPPHSVVELVSADMRLNGIPMRIWQFESESSLESVVASYEAQWNGLEKDQSSDAQQGKRAVGVARPDKSTTIISRLHGIFYLTVTVKRGKSGTSRGSLSVAKYGGSVGRMNLEGMFVSPGARPFSVMESADAGRISKMVVLLTNQRLSVVESYYQTALASNGWKLLDQHTGKGQFSDTKSLVQIYRNMTGGEYHVLLSEDKSRNGTVVRVNKVTSEN